MRQSPRTNSCTGIADPLSPRLLMELSRQGYCRLTICCSWWVALQKTDRTEGYPYIRVTAVELLTKTPNHVEYVVTVVSHLVCHEEPAVALYRSSNACCWDPWQTSITITERDTTPTSHKIPLRMSTHLKFRTESISAGLLLWACDLPRKQWDSLEFCGISRKWNYWHNLLVLVM